MPNVVKGSKQHRMVIVPYRPWARLLTICGVLFGCVAVGGGSFVLGRVVAARDYEINSADNQRLSGALAQAQAELDSLRSEVAITGRSNLVDQAANEEVQNTISALRQRIMQLEQDVSFYRQVMAPESAELGLIIAEFDVTPLEADRRFHYRAVFRQAGAGDRVLEGGVEVAIAGHVAGERQRLSLAEIVSPAEAFNPALNFRYFQNLEGEFQLPEGFVPEQVEVRAESSKPAKNKVEKIFSWSVVEG